MKARAYVPFSGPGWGEWIRQPPPVFPCKRCKHPNSNSQGHTLAYCDAHEIDEAIPDKPGFNISPTKWATKGKARICDAVGCQRYAQHVHKTQAANVCGRHQNVPFVELKTYVASIEGGAMDRRA